MTIDKNKVLDIIKNKVTYLSSRLTLDTNRLADVRDCYVLPEISRFRAELLKEIELEVAKPQLTKTEKEFIIMVFEQMEEPESKSILEKIKEME